MGLLDILRPKKPLQGELVFKENVGAFEYACKYIDCTVAEGRTLVALVEEIEFVLKDGRQSCSLRLASNTGGRELHLCETLNQNVPPLKVGDFVAYEIIGLFPESQSTLAMLSVMGFIVAKLEPAWSIDHSGWRISKH